MSGLREQTKDAIQALWLEGKSGPEEYADEALKGFADWLESEAAGRELLASAPQSLTDDARRWQEVFRHTADAKVIRALAQSLKGGE